MWHQLEKIRAKPVKVRKQILLATTTLITLVIFAVWVSIFISDISSTTVESKAEDSRGVFSFLTVFKNATSDILKSQASTYIRQESVKP